MIEFKGNIWKKAEELNAFVIVPTNGCIKVNGNAVMGRGLAKQASRIHPTLARLLGKGIRIHGNVVSVFSEFGVVTFPVKDNWWERADLNLIYTSADCLLDIALLAPKKTFLVPHVGCGNGRLKWSDVKPILQKVFDDVGNIMICDWKE